jgi:hypothetical protein
MVVNYSCIFNEKEGLARKEAGSMLLSFFAPWNICTLSTYVVFFTFAKIDAVFSTVTDFLS